MKRCELHEDEENENSSISKKSYFSSSFANSKKIWNFGWQKAIWIGFKSKFNEYLTILVFRFIRSQKHIIVILGAGVSVDAGIPDFRSPVVVVYNALFVERTV